MSGVSQKLINQQGKEAGAFELEPAVFDAAPSRSLVHATVVWQRNKARAGTHSALTKAEVSGGGKKPFKQKGTGRARAGSNTSPLWIGGGVIFPPKPRDYTSRLPRRSRQQALCEALSVKRKGEGLLILEKIELTDGKTKSCVAMFEKLGIAGKKILVVGEQQSDGLERACRNIAKVKYLPVAGVNVYDVLNCDVLLASKSSVEALQARLKQKA
ncbi:MAG: 50S ribosomal protein L4 [Deltaproteobacteria bacterium]|nr:50S ribosomal protein L4 [Deltaproteobacteria bacterium]